MSCFAPSLQNSFVHHLVTGLRLELLLTPKPGLVDAWDSGSHPDLTFALMSRSIGHLADYLTALQNALDVDAPLRQLIEIGRRAETSLLQDLQTNTHKGAIFLSGLLLCTWHRCGEFNESAMRETLAGFAAEVLALTARDETHGQQARRRFGVGGVLAEAGKGLPALFETGLPAYREGIRRGWDHERSSWLVMARLMRTVEDTTTLHRCGLAGLERLRRDGAALEKLLFDEKPVRTHLAELNARYRSLHLTMGGIADMLAMSFALLSACGQLLPSDQDPSLADLTFAVALT